jgi:hypothetical protein
MPTDPDHQRLPEPPRAGRDPITGVADVLSIVRLAVTLPLRPELVVLLLDEHRCGHTLSVFERGESLLTVVLGLLQHGASGSQLRACVLVSVRPGGGPEADDDERWHEADALLAASGLELLEWLVVGQRGVTSIPDGLGLTSRW